VQTSQTGRAQKLSKAAFCLSRFQRNSIQQQLVVGNTEQEAAFASRGQTVLQFIPGGLKLGFRALVIRPVHARVLDQNIQAVDESPRGGRTVCVKCGSVADKTPLNPQVWL